MHELISIFKSSPLLFIGSVGLLALIIGSFLNVVICRLPKILFCNWRQQCFEFLEQPVPADDQEKIKHHENSVCKLVLPRSACPHCHAAIKPYDNIPLLGFIFLRGKCRNCSKKISWQYPIVEAITAATCILVAAHFGVTWQTAAGCLFVCVLIVQATIDLQHTIIPDEITLLMLWIGLLLSLSNIFVDPQTAIIGAAAGYLILWIIYWLFYLVTKKEGMGFGDFKLLAMLGAWLGWQALPFIVLFSSALGAIVGVMYLLLTKKTTNHRIPFGPFLAMAGIIALLWGSSINQWYIAYAFAPPIIPNLKFGPMQ
jgi:leader peptidase (prepilin peptidase)/N-methyltransferase